MKEEYVANDILAIYPEGTRNGFEKGVNPTKYANEHIYMFKYEGAIRRIILQYKFQPQLFNP